MSLPASPTNGQIATVNGVNYVYSTATNSWTRIPDLLTSLGNIVATGYILANGNITSNSSITASQYYWANGTPFSSSNYGNVDVDAYLSSYFTYANANAATQATAIDSINANLGAYQVYANANAATQATAIDSINANIGSYQTYANANAATQTAAIDNINANIGAYQIYANANAAAQTTAFNTLDANVGAYEIWANSAITGLQSNAAIQGNLIDILTGNAATQGSLLDVLVTNAAVQSANLASLLSNAAAQEASLTSLVSNAALQSTAIDTLNANIGSYQLYANANAAAQSIEISGLRANINAANSAIITANTGMKSYVDAQVIGAGTYSNANVASYLPVYSGNITANNITATGNIVGGGVRYTASATAPANPVVGDVWYDTTLDILFKYVTDGVSSYWIDHSSPEVQLANYGNAQVATYLPVYSGNISAGNIATTGQINVGSTLFVSGNIIPTSNNTLSLGDATHRFGSLYLSGNTIYLGGTIITENTTLGQITFVPPATIATPNPTAVVFYGNGSITAAETSGGAVTGNTVTPAFANLTVTGNITSGNVSGTTASFTNLSGTLATASQPNITTVGTLGNLTVSGNITGNTNGFSIGYLEIPQVSLGSNITLALTNTGKHFYSTSASVIGITIPTNANVAFNVGTVVTLVNQGTGSIRVTPDTGVSLYTGGGNSTSLARTVSSYGVASLMKVATNTWFINGAGIT